MIYYLNGWEESLNYILNSTDAFEVARDETTIWFETNDLDLEILLPV